MQTTQTLRKPEIDTDRLDRDEDRYWRDNYRSRDYVASGESYDTYEPAYRYGWRERMNRMDARWEDTESDLERGWDRFKDKSKLTWAEAKGAVRDAWHRVEHALPGDADGDGR